MEDSKLKELIVENQNLIYSIIHKFRSRDYEDLFQVGCIGLINAYKKFNDTKNTKFTSYAYNYILGEVYQYIINNRNIRLSPANIKLLKAVNRAEDVLINHLGRYPTIMEICSFLEIEPLKYYEIKNIMLSENINYDDYINNISYCDKISKDDLIDLKNALSSLSDAEKKLINARYYDNYTQEKLAKAYHTNQVKIYREEKEILNKLKVKMY